MGVAQRDTLDKIVKYFYGVTKEPFYYKGKWYHPKPLRVSPGLFRGYTCPPMCGGCCANFTLDYLPHERHPYELEPRWIYFYKPNASTPYVTIYSDKQEENTGAKCKHLQWEDGRCGIHFIGKPFACDFELIRFRITKDQYKPNQMTQMLFGRGWQFPRVDGGRGALCEMLPATKEHTDDAVRRLEELNKWTDHFGLETCLPELIDWAKEGPHAEPIFLNQEFDIEQSEVGTPII